MKPGLYSSIFFSFTPFPSLWLPIFHSPAAHGGRPLPMGWVYWPNCMQYRWTGTPRIALSRDASAWDFFLIWHLARHNGNLPVLGNISKWSLLLSYNIWQDAKNSWPAAKSTAPDPPRSWSDPYLTSVPKIGPENLFFLLFDPWPLTLDLYFLT